MTQTRAEVPSSRPSGRGGRFGRFLREVISEMSKVIWPTRQELATYTAVVVVFVVVMVAFVALLDFGLAKLILGVFG